MFKMSTLTAFKNSKPFGVASGSLILLANAFGVKFLSNLDFETGQPRCYHPPPVRGARYALIQNKTASLIANEFNYTDHSPDTFKCP